MADSPAFDWLCRELEAISSLDRLEARGTVRIALKQAGLEARNVTPDQLEVVARKILPGELAQRAVDWPDSICEQLVAGLKNLDQDGSDTDSPEAVFDRLGSGY
jgi:hypothetical protein